MVTKAVPKLVKKPPVPVSFLELTEQENGYVKRDIDWSALIWRALTEPGRLHAGYTAFWEYSVGNQMLAFAQCLERGIPTGPIGSKRKWEERGRTIKKGERALILCKPIICREKPEQAKNPQEPGTFILFRYPARWFVLAQTEGDEWTPEPLPNWDRTLALLRLSITEKPYSAFSGNMQGYSVPGDRTLAINPLAVYPNKTTFHELAHILCGHGHSSDLSASSQEVEAELVAFLLCHTLQIDVGGLESARAYVQNYYERSRGVFSKSMCQAVFRVANEILEAGYTSSRKWSRKADEE